MHLRGQFFVVVLSGRRDILEWKTWTTVLQHPLKSFFCTIVSLQGAYIPSYDTTLWRRGFSQFWKPMSSLHNWVFRFLNITSPSPTFRPPKMSSTYSLSVLLYFIDCPWENRGFSDMKKNRGRPILNLSWWDVRLYHAIDKSKISRLDDLYWGSGKSPTKNKIEYLQHITIDRSQFLCLDRGVF